MPLVKEICKRCINTHSAVQWNRNDESRWRDGLVGCKMSRHFIKIASDAPPRCLMALEQTVLGQTQGLLPSNLCEIDSGKDGLQGQEKSCR